MKIPKNHKLMMLEGKLNFAIRTGNEPLALKTEDEIKNLTKQNEKSNHPSQKEETKKQG